MRGCRVQHPREVRAMPKVRTSDRVEINYQLDDFRDPWVAGPGETIVMSHGFARSMVWWTQWVPALSRRYRVLRYDIRGCGHSSIPPEGAEWSADRIAGDVVDLIDHLSIPRVHWVGFESGGLWGIVFAVNHPDRIASLSLCNTPGGVGTGHFAASGVRAADEIRKVGFKQWLIDTRATRMDLALADSRLDKWHIEEHSRTPTGVAAALMDVLEVLDVSGMHSRIRVPTLIMYSDKARVWRTIPNARLVTFPNMAAGIQLLIPDRCTQEVLRFLDETTSS
jgi:3-oxoadipate enol-lactonase